MSIAPPPSASAGSNLPPQAKRTNGLAIASLIFGVLGCIPFLSGLLAVVLGFLGIRKARDPQVGGKGLAIAGIVLGIVSLGVWSAFGGTFLALLRGTEAERGTTKQFVTDVAAGKTEAALAKASGISAEELGALTATMQAWGGLSDVTCNSFGYHGGQCRVAGTMTFGGVVKPFTAVLVEAGEDQWKVAGLTFQ